MTDSKAPERAAAFAKEEGLSRELSTRQMAMIAIGGSSLYAFMTTPESAVPNLQEFRSLQGLPAPDVR